MAVKAPAVRRTDSLYAQLGGKANVAAIVDRFYEKMLADLGHPSAARESQSRLAQDSARRSF